MYRRFTSRTVDFGRVTAIRDFSTARYGSIEQLLSVALDVATTRNNSIKLTYNKMLGIDIATTIYRKLPCWQYHAPQYRRYPKHVEKRSLS